MKMTEEQELKIYEIRRRAWSICELIDGFNAAKDDLEQDLMECVDDDIETLHNLKEALWNSIDFEDEEREMTQNDAHD